MVSIFTGRWAVAPAALLVPALLWGCGAGGGESAPPLAAERVEELVVLMNRPEREAAAEQRRARREIEAAGRRAIPLLIRLLDSSRPHTREWAADRLGELRAVEAVEALVRALGDPRNRPQRVRLLEPRGAGFVMSSFRDRDVQTALLLALRAIGSPAETPLRRLYRRSIAGGDDEARAAAEQALALIGVDVSEGSREVSPAP